MAKKLEFDEVDLLNANWSGMKAIAAKTKKDAVDLNALSKGTAAITKFLSVKLSWQKYADSRGAKALGSKPKLFLS